jgi:signal transduction histidine kinase
MAPGQYVSLNFVDSAHGIEEKKLALIFEPFFSTKENGAEVGLTDIMDIVRRHGAHIEVFSIVGTGTTFRIYFRSPGCV